MQSKQSEGDKDKVELRHDGWAQFERAVDAAVKGGPKHKAKAGAKASLQHGQPVIELFEELRLLLEQPGVPRSAADSFLQLIQRLDKCFRMKFAYESAARTGKATIVLEPRYVLVPIAARRFAEAGGEETIGG
jgi:hypothetical protein